MSVNCLIVKFVLFTFIYVVAGLSHIKEYKIVSVLLFHLCHLIFLYDINEIVTQKLLLYKLFDISYSLFTST